MQLKCHGLLVFLLLQARVYAVEELLQLMAASDYVVISLPLTPATEGLVSGHSLYCAAHST